MYPGEHTEGGAPLIRVGDVAGGGTVQATSMCIAPAVHHEYRRTELSGNELLITLVGTPGICILAQPRMDGWNVARALAVARMKSPELRPYVKAVLESSVMRNIILSMLNTTVQPTLNLKEIKILPVPMPRQAGVALALGDVAELFNQRIGLLQQTNTTLEAIAQALFKSWFVDFDPVHAKAEGREPEAMDAATAALFPSEFEESELGLIPKGWSVAPFGDSVTILGGGTPKTSIPEYWDGDIPWFSVVDAPATGQVFTLDTTKKITRLGLDSCSAKLLPSMTTIISARGTVGKVAMTGCEMVMNQSCYGLRPKVIGGEPFTYFSTLRFVDGLRQIAHGAVFDTITRSSFDQLSACRPPNDAIACFGATTMPLLDRIRMNGRQAVALTQLRDTLLPRLISGKLRLPEATSQVEIETSV